MLKFAQGQNVHTDVIISLVAISYCSLYLPTFDRTKIRQGSLDRRLRD